MSSSFLKFGRILVMNNLLVLSPFFSISETPIVYIVLLMVSLDILTTSLFYSFIVIIVVPWTGLFQVAHL